MKGMLLCLAMTLLAAPVQAKDLLIGIDGKEIRIGYVPINHRITPGDKGKGSRTGAMNCSFLYHSLLATGNIAGAAALSVDPARDAEKWTNYRERLGDGEFREMMNAYFTSGNEVVAEVVLGDETMLAVRTEDGVLAQFYRKDAETYTVTDKPAAGKAFGKILAMIREGKIPR